MRVFLVVLALAAAGSVADETSVPAWRGRFPNVPLRTHDGRTVRFYDDLLRGKIVTINFMYVECEGTCPGLTSTLVELQKKLGDRVGRDILMLSLTVQPEADTPERLRAYAARYGAGPGMVFLTGSPADIDTLRRALGFFDERNPGADRRQHLGILRVGNESRDWWTSCPSVSDAGQIGALLRSVDAPAVDFKPPLENPEGPPTAAPLELPDLTEFDALRAGLEQLHMSRTRLEWPEYVKQAQSRMAGFLRLSAEREAAWRAAMDRALKDSVGARRRLEAVRAQRGDLRAAWRRYQEELARAVAGLDPVLDGSPRHRAFRNAGLRFLFILEGHPDHTENSR